MLDVVIATTNTGKFKEIGKLLKDPNINLIPLSDFHDVVIPDETGKTYLENAKIKAETVLNHTGKITIADDSGLEVEALNNGPGIHSARYGSKYLPFSEKINKMLFEMAEIPIEKRKAKFVCCAVVMFPKEFTEYKIPNTEYHFQGECLGNIGFEPRGYMGFGFDPIFYPDGYELTMAEIDETEKNNISHRGIAFKKLKYFLTNEFSFAT
ncbi:MAG: RdgB/HAM1 family non-canonical purine NTP pyrophosphatase [Pseudomonadota bacterium]